MQYILSFTETNTLCQARRSINWDKEEVASPRIHVGGDVTLSRDRSNEGLSDVITRHGRSMKNKRRNQFCKKVYKFGKTLVQKIILTFVSARHTIVCHAQYRHEKCKQFAIIQIFVTIFTCRCAHPFEDHHMSMLISFCILNDFVKDFTVQLL